MEADKGAEKNYGEEGSTSHARDPLQKVILILSALKKEERVAIAVPSGSQKAQGGVYLSGEPAAMTPIVF